MFDESFYRLKLFHDELLREIIRHFGERPARGLSKFVSALMLSRMIRCLFRSKLTKVWQECEVVAKLAAMAFPDRLAGYSTHADGQSGH